MPLSSHSSVPCLNPSPHWTSQFELVASGLVPPVQAAQVSAADAEPPVHINPDSIVQVALHPSPNVVPVSSHSSPTSLNPFPHIDARFLLSPYSSESPRLLKLNKSFCKLISSVTPYNI